MPYSCKRACLLRTQACEYEGNSVVEVKVRGDEHVDKESPSWQG